MGRVAASEAQYEAGPHLIDIWNALSADDRDDITAAVTEQQHLMDSHGLTGFRICTRTWTDAGPSAADVRAETDLLRTVLASRPRT
ncbi:hypothetical protein ACNHUS_35395 [Actinomycetes bacterium M1A6_2h]